jgi:hypothetical protein
MELLRELKCAKVALERTYTDLSAHNPSFTLLIDSTLIFCKTLRWEAPLGVETPLLVIP